ncbi:S8 family serine peptidase [Persicobacter diffluens]
MSFLKSKVLMLAMLLIMGASAWGQTTFEGEQVLFNGGTIALPENAQHFFELQKKGRSGAETYYVILQFYQLPNQQMREELKNQGLVLNEYLGNNAYITAVSAVPSRSAEKRIRSVISLNEVQKLNPALLEAELPRHALAGNNKIKLELLYFSDVDRSQIQSDLQQLGAERIHFSTYFNRISCQLNISNLQKLNDFFWLKYVTPLAPMAESDDLPGNLMSGQSALKTHLGADKTLTGKGIILGIWDQDVEHHMDFNGRVTNHELEDHLFAHGNHVAGIMAGKGLVDPQAEGIAHNAKIESFNFNVGTNGLTTAEEMMAAADNLGIHITQNSYGIPHAGGFYWPYLPSDADLDLVTYVHPGLLHVYSSGNSRGTVTYGTSSKSAKNILTVGALTDMGEMSSFSSWGPVSDGRFGPHICARGTEVYSCSFYNDYEQMDGTSQATPIVSGVAAQLYELYQGKFNGSMPSAALIKGILCNTATDLGPEGPDFGYGYGDLNALRAVKAIENAQFWEQSLDQEEEQTFDIWVPKGIRQLKIMLTWSDAPAGPFSAKNLVNDLDLKVSKGSRRYLPLVLNGERPADLAVKGEDHLNNIEQVVIDVPEEGYYTLAVKGFEVAKGPQDFSVCWDFVEEGIDILAPVGGESYEAGKRMLVYWTAPQNHQEPFVIQFSEDAGLTYKTIAEVPSNVRNYAFPAPEGALGKARMRVISGKHFKSSTGDFCIMGRPVLVEGSENALSWEEVEGASSYEILKIVGDHLEVEAEIAATQYQAEDGWYSVRAINRSKGAFSQRAKAIDFRKREYASNFPFLEDFEGGDSPYIKISKSEHANATVNFDTDQQSHYLKFEGGLSGMAYDASGTAAQVWAKNAPFISMAKLKTEIPDGLESMVLSFDLKQSSSVAPNQSVFRIYVNGEAVNDVTGESYFTGREGQLTSEARMYFDLSDYLGGDMDIEFRAMCRYPSGVIAWAPQGDAVGIDNIKLYEKQAYDLTVVNLSHPKSSLRMGEGLVEMQVANVGSQAVDDYQLYYKIKENDLEGTAVEETPGQSLASFEVMEYTFDTKGDFSLEDARYMVEAGIKLANDMDQENNAISGNPFYNFGDIVPMAAHDYTQTTFVNQSVIFTDGGGRVFNYPDATHSIHTFLPADPSKKLKVSFEEITLEKDYDYLYIYDGSNVGGEPFVTMNGGAADHPELSFISSANNGGLTFRFYSDEMINEAGWIAKIEEVAPTIEFDLGVTAILHPTTSHGLTAAEHVAVLVSNFGKQKVDQYQVAYQVNDNSPVVLSVNTPLEPGDQQDFEFPEMEILNEFGKPYHIKAYTIFEEDELARNDTSRVAFQSDYEDALGFGIIYISNVSIGEINQSSGDNMYEDHSNQEVTMEYGKEYLLSVTKNDSYGEGMFWIDWNFDGVFTEEETYAFEPEGSHGMKAVITPPYDVEAGKKRLRIRVISFGLMEPVGVSFTGEVEDYTINLIGTPPMNDLAVAAIGMDRYQAPGDKMLPVTIWNKGKSRQDYELTLQINGTEVASKSIKDHEAGTQKEVKFSSYHFSEGQYEIKVSLTAQNDEVSVNNSRELEVQVMPLNTVYAYNILGGEGLAPGPVKFHLQNLQETFNVDSRRNFYVYAGTIANNNWYVSSSGGKLSTLDALSGELDLLGISEVEFRDMAYSEPTGKLYGKAYYSADIHEISMENGRSKVVGTLSNESIKTITADISGQFYGLDDLGNLYRLYEGSWTTELIGNIGIFVGTAPHPHLFWDHNEGKMYLACRDNLKTSDYYHIWQLDPETATLYDGEINEALSKSIGFAMFYDAPKARGLNELNLVKIQDHFSNGIINPSAKEVLIYPTASMNLQNVPLEFSASPGAKISYQGQEIKTGAAFDLTQNMIWEVRSMDGVNTSLWSIKVMDPLNDGADLNAYGILAKHNPLVSEDMEGVLEAGEWIIQANKEDDLSQTKVSFEAAVGAQVLMGKDTLKSEKSMIDHSRGQFMLKVVAEDGVSNHYYPVVSRQVINDAHLLKSLVIPAALNENMEEDMVAVIEGDNIYFEENLTLDDQEYVMEYVISTGAVLTQFQRIKLNGTDPILVNEESAVTIIAEDGLSQKHYFFRSKQTLTTSPPASNRINCYPNPANEQLNVIHQEAGTIMIMELSGRVVLKQKLERGESKLNVSALETGLYIVHFRGTNGEYWSTEQLIR